MGHIILIVGGCRSGKTAFAHSIPRDYQKVLYLATAQAHDEEMRERIEEHRKQRPPHWQTVEAPQEMAKSLKNIDKNIDIVLIDCLTLYLNNFILNRELDRQKCRQEWERELDELLEVSQKIKPTIVFVSNELGQGIVPGTPLARIYRDLHGAMNQAAARVADQVYKMEVGIPIQIKGGT